MRRSVVAYGLVLIAGGVCVSLWDVSLGYAEERPAVSVRIETLRGREPAAIDYQQEFGVVLTNESNQTLRFWKNGSKQGFGQISFVFKNVRTGASWKVHRPAGERNSTGDPSGKLTPAEADICEIDPRDSYVIPVKFDRMIVDEPMWIGFPRSQFGRSI